MRNAELIKNIYLYFYLKESTIRTNMQEKMKMRSIQLLKEASEDEFEEQELHASFYSINCFYSNFHY